jgi:DNA-binding transcriptional LysR family regulator
MKEKLSTVMERVTLKQLRALEAATRTGSVSAAARVLHVTPPAVSLQLRLLAETAGLPLVERAGHSLRPTAAGTELLAAAKRIEAALVECGDALRALSGLKGGHAAVGAVSTAKYFAPHVLAAFAKAHPNIDVRLQVGNRQEIVAALGGYELDFAVMGRAPRDFKVEQAVIGDHPHIIVGPPDHPMARRRHLKLADLADETFLLREQGSGTRLLMQRLFADAGLNPNLGMEIGSNETIKQAVMAGLGIALISAHTVSAELEDGRLIAFDIDGLPLVRQWFVVRRRDKRLLPAAQAVWDFLARDGAKFLPDSVSGKSAKQRARKSA